MVSHCCGEGLRSWPGTRSPRRQGRRLGAARKGLALTMAGPRVRASRSSRSPRRRTTCSPGGHGRRPGCRAQKLHPGPNRPLINLMQPNENRLRRGRVFSGARGGLHHVFHACDSTDEIFAPYRLPVLHTTPLSHMPSPLPRRNRWVRVSFSFPNGGGLPPNEGGSASALRFSRPAQRSLHVTAYTLAESLTDPLHQKLRPVRYLHGRSDCYRLERLLPGGIRTH